MVMTRIISTKQFKMLNLNKKELTKDNLMLYVHDVDVYKHYTGQEVGKGNILSPLREEKNPSFGYYVGKSGEICFNDFLLGKGDCIKFVQLYFGLNFNDAMSRIVIDFNLTDKLEYSDLGKGVIATHTLNRDKYLKVLKENRTIGIRRRNWELYDLKFWHDFGILKPTLNKYRVTPIDYIFINGNPIKTETYAYAFIELKDGKETYKIYQPFSSNFKWINNHDESVWQGWTQLPKKGEILIVTKSLKDVMTINDVLGLPAISLQSETVTPKDKIIKELKNRFTDIYILYDNDYDKEVNWGEEYSRKISLEYGLYFSQIPTKYQSKDISDLTKNIGVEKTKKIWEDEISIPF